MSENPQSVKQSSSEGSVCDVHNVLHHHAGSPPTAPSACLLLETSAISSCATLTQITAHCWATCCGKESSGEVSGSSQSSSSAWRARAVQYRERMGRKRRSLTWRKLEVEKN